MENLVSYQREVDKLGKLTAVASFEKLTDVSSVSPSSEQRGRATKGSRSERQLFKTRYGV